MKLAAADPQIVAETVSHFHTPPPVCPRAKLTKSRIISGKYHPRRKSTQEPIPSPRRINYSPLLLLLPVRGRPALPGGTDSVRPVLACTEDDCRYCTAGRLG